MRTIKFRSWKEGKMLYSDNYPDLASFFTLAHGQLGERNMGLLQEFTGLKNAIRKDGFNEHGDYKTYKELYEMDIVEITGNTEFNLGKDFKRERFVICYQAELGGGFCLKHISTFSIPHACYESINGWMPIRPYEFSNLINHFEVIGNIYENPKLLVTNYIQK